MSTVCRSGVKRGPKKASRTKKTTPRKPMNPALLRAIARRKPTPTPATWRAGLGRGTAAMLVPLVWAPPLLLLCDPDPGVDEDLLDQERPADDEADRDRQLGEERQYRVAADVGGGDPPVAQAAGAGDGDIIFVEGGHRRGLHQQH